MISAGGGAVHARFTADPPAVARAWTSDRLPL